MPPLQSKNPARSIRNFRCCQNIFTDSQNSTMKQFKIRPEAFTEIRKQLLLRVLPVAVIAVAAGITIGSINSKNKETNTSVLPFVIPLVVVAVGSGLFRSIHRQKALLCSFNLTITNNMISREQLNTPTVSIYQSELREIVKNKNAGFTVKGKEATDVIYIPRQVERYAELEAELALLRPVTTKSTEPLLQKYRSLFSLFSIGLLLCVYVATNKMAVGISGTLIAGLLVWSFVETRRSKNIDAKTKRSLWWVLVVLASVLFTVYIKIAGVIPH